MPLPYLTVRLPDVLYNKIRVFWRRECPDYLTMGSVMERIMRDGLAQAGEANLRRTKVGLAGVATRLHSISMSQDAWDLVTKHMQDHGLPSRNESVRELLRLGLGLGEPRSAPGNALTKPTRLAANRQKIVHLADQGKPIPDIARAFGISRARVYKVLQEEGVPRMSA